MKQINITILLPFIFLSCISSTKNEKLIESDKVMEQTNSDFESYLSTLDQITLPLETNPLGVATFIWTLS